MELIINRSEGIKFAEVKADGWMLNDLEDAVDLLGNSDYLGAAGTIIHQEQINPDFFDLKTGLAGDILQKFSNYRKKLAIVGDFSEVSSKSLRDFIRESNRTGSINFVQSLEEARRVLSKG